MYKRQIYNYYVKNTSFSLEETELTADQYEARVAGVTERFPFLVARDDAGNVAGFAYLSDFNPRSGYRHTADLSKMCIRDRCCSCIPPFLWRWHFSPC